MSPSPTGKSSEALASAVSLLRAGQHSQAQRVLVGVVARQPDLCDAHWLLAGSLFESGDLDGALLELRTVIRLDPRRAVAYLMAARALGALGNTQEAAQMLERALGLDNQPTTACALARLLLAQNQFEQVCLVLQPFVEQHKDSPDLLLLHGHAAMLLRRPVNASQSFEQLVALLPRNADARLRWAAALSDCGKHAEAEAQVRAAMQLGTDTPEARFVLGRALMGQNKMREAEPEFRRVVHANPAHLVAQANLCELAWMQSGDVAFASREIDEALAKQPGLFPLRLSKARLLVAAGDSAAALAEIERGMALDPDNFDLRLAAAQVALGNDPQRAVDHAKDALRLVPAQARALSALGDALLAVGDHVRAVEIAQKLLTVAPEDGRAIALLATAWRMGGDPRYRELFDYDNFVRTQLIDVPPGWTTLGQYLADLAAALHRLHSLAAHPIGQSLRGGSQLELDFDRTPEPAVGAFAKAIEGPILRYMEALGPGTDVMRRRNTGKFLIKGAWSVRLKPDGFHVNHFHPEGWLSSACYIQLPPAVETMGREGWLQFGEPGFATSPPLAPERFVKPEPGLLALFPSYMWHGTVPFSGTADESRLTIAFDVLPG